MSEESRRVQCRRGQKKLLEKGVNSTKCFKGVSLRTKSTTGSFDMEVLGSQGSGPIGGMGAEVRSGRVVREQNVKNGVGQCSNSFMMLVLKKGDEAHHGSRKVT